MSKLPSAEERLIASRERLQSSMRSPTARRDGSASSSASRTGDAWKRSLHSIPGSAVIIDAVRSWWAQHPMRVAGIVAAEVGDAAIRPLAQRHPLALAAGAVLMGGLFAWARPWRWLSTTAVFAGLLPQLLSKAMASVPLHDWVEALARPPEVRASPGNTSMPVAGSN